MRFLSMKEVRARTSLSKVHIYRLISEDQFPAQVPLGPARVAWLETEVDEWMEARLRDRDS